MGYEIVDDLRLTVQKDVDLPLIPRADGRVLLPMAIQFPAALCDAMEELPSMTASTFRPHRPPARPSRYHVRDGRGTGQRPGQARPPHE